MFNNEKTKTLIVNKTLSETRKYINKKLHKINSYGGNYEREALQEIMDSPEESSFLKNDSTSSEEKFNPYVILITDGMIDARTWSLT